MADNAFGTGERTTKKKNEASHFLLWDFEKKNKNIACLVMLWLEEESMKTK